MSDDQQIAVPPNRPDDCFTERPPNDEDIAARPLHSPIYDDAAAAASPVAPPTDEDAAAFPVHPQIDEDSATFLVPSPMDEDAAAECPEQPAEDEDAAAHPLYPPMDEDAAAAECPEQPPTDDAAAVCLEQPPEDEVAAVDLDAHRPEPMLCDDAHRSEPMLCDDAEMPSVDEAVQPAPPLMDDDGLASSPPMDNAGPASPPNNDGSDAASLLPPNIDAGPAPQSVDNAVLPLNPTTASKPSGSTIPLVPKVEPESSYANGSEATAGAHGYDAGVQLKQEIKHETIDLGSDTYFYDDNNKAILIKGTPKVGFDRGLEPDHIVGATEVDGKLMFLIAWKNSEVADLLESSVVYDKAPQLAIQFFEARLRYCPKK